MSEVDIATRQIPVDRDYVLDLIRAAARRHDLEPALVAAVVEQETAGTWSPWSHRTERGYRYLWHPTAGSARPLPASDPLTLPADWPSWLPWKISGDTEFWDQKTSWGLCHVMGAVARELGFVGILSRLCRPDLGLEYGCRYLARQFARYAGDRDLALEAYNDGRGDRLGPGVRYAGQVQKRIARLHQVLDELEEEPCSRS